LSEKKCRDFSVNDLIVLGFLTLYSVIVLALVLYFSKQKVRWLFAGLMGLYQQVSEKFKIILAPSSTHHQEISVLKVSTSDLNVSNINYIRYNPFIFQYKCKTECLDKAHQGAMFVGYLKLLKLLVVVISGILVFKFDVGILRSDVAYSWLLGEFIMTGSQGLVLASLISAILSTFNSMTCNTFTKCTLHNYKIHLQDEVSQINLVLIGISLLESNKAGEKTTRFNINHFRMDRVFEIGSSVFVRI